MAVKNLVSGVLAQSITTSTTNVLVNIADNIDASGIQSFFPTPPFYITIMPKTPTVGVANRLDSEILQVTAVGNGQSGNASLTCVRGQRDTTAKSFDVGSIVTVGIYADDAVFLGGEGSAVENPAPWIETSDIKNGAITTNKIADGAVKSAKIDWATFNCGIVSNPDSNTIPANGRTRIAQITLPKGKYALIATASYWASSAARRCLYISFESSTGGTINSMKNGLYGTTAGGDTLEATNTALVDITAGQATVSVYANSQDFSGTFHQWGAPSVLFFRVG